MANYLTCEGNIIVYTIRLRGNDVNSTYCETGYVIQEAPDSSGVQGASIDYIQSGQYFTSAFFVCASIVVTSVVVRTLLGYIRR